MLKFKKKQIKIFLFDVCYDFKREIVSVKDSYNAKVF